MLIVDLLTLFSILFFGYFFSSGGKALFNVISKSHSRALKSEIKTLPYSIQILWAGITWLFPFFYICKGMPINYPNIIFSIIYTYAPVAILLVTAQLRYINTEKNRESILISSYLASLLLSFLIGFLAILLIRVIIRAGHLYMKMEEEDMVSFYRYVPLVVFWTYIFCFILRAGRFLIEARKDGVITGYLLLYFCIELLFTIANMKILRCK